MIDRRVLKERLGDFLTGLLPVLVLIVAFFVGYVLVSMAVSK